MFAVGDISPGTLPITLAMKMKRPIVPMSGR